MLRPVLLVTIHFSDEHIDLLGQHFDVLYAPTIEQRNEAIASRGAQIRMVLTNGATGLTAQEMAQLPALEMVSALGAGYENIDLVAARARGIRLSNGSGTNAACVADHAVGLLIAVVRRLVPLHHAALNATSRNTLPISANFSGKRMGIIGLGQIGCDIARRAAGFDIEVAYHNRRRREDVSYRWFPDALSLADWADYLIVATPGGAETHHLINAALLARLGSKGYVVNIGRGSVVDSDALGAALHAGTIAGAGLDVYEGEPKLAKALQDAPNLVVTPHVAGWSPESIDNTVHNFIANVSAYLSGAPLLTPI